MPTLRQHKLARKIVESSALDKPPNLGAVLESAGYPTSSARATPGKIVKQKGVQEALKDLGFTTDGADSVVQKIMYKSKREDMKLRAADMVYKRLGAYEDTKQGAGKTLVLMVSGETAQRYALTPDTETDSSGPAQV